MKTLGIIPSRFSSTRFPGKPMVKIQGKTMIQRVYEQACKANLLDQVIVATDDQRIFDHIQSFNGAVMMTSSAHPSGTDRCAEVANNFQDMEAIINIQGDEPFIDPYQIDLLINSLRQNKDLNLATLAIKITDIDLIFSPNIVKVVFNHQNLANYFSRSPIPYIRDTPKASWPKVGNFYKHIGLYAYRSQTLLQIAQLQPSRLEKSEKLEQLRWLENGFKIGICITNTETIGIDSPEDLERLLDQHQF